MDDFLCSDLDRACLDNYTSWNNLRAQVSANEGVPLPASNTLAAKSMRIAAGLAILSRALAESIFRPTHVTQDHELDIVLDRLSCQDPPQEVYTRATLLKVLPDRQRRNQEASVESVVEQVSRILNHMVPSSRKDEFRLSLQRVTEKICHGWCMVQKLQERVKPNFSFDLPDDWQQLPPASSRASSSTSAQPTTQRVKRGQQGQQKPPTSSSSAPAPNPIANEDYREAVWPAFLAANLEQSQQEMDEEDSTELPLAVILQGYVLTNAQAKGAEQERNTEQEASRRARKIARQNGSNTHQPTRKRRNSAIDFLKSSREGPAEGDVYK
jgi:hypothetical protein